MNFKLSHQTKPIENENVRWCYELNLEKNVKKESQFVQRIGIAICFALFETISMVLALLFFFENIELMGLFYSIYRQKIAIK